MLLRIVLALVMSLVAGCAAAKPGDPGAATTDYSWLKQKNLFDRFDTTARDFSPLNAYLLALAVRAGDMNTSDQAATLKTWGFKKHEPIIDRNASVYAYVASNDRMVLAVFSGTDIRNIRDLESDADALYPVQREHYSRVGGALLHRGFATNMDAIWDAVTKEVKSQAKGRSGAPPKPVFIAGHSRGGAFAMLAAAGWAQENAVPVAALYTFGQPKVGNVEFAHGFASLSIPYFRLINERDAVPGVPIKIGNLGTDYAHAGVVGHLTASTQLRKDPPASSMQFFVIDPDHYMDGYLRKLYTVVTEPKRIEDATWRATLVSGTPSTSPTTQPALPRPPG
jgi:hypothetical protein